MNIPSAYLYGTAYFRPPNQVDITRFCDGRRVAIGIEVLGHCRNSHGPFHLANRWPSWTGPAEFRRKEIDRYQLVPCGLLAPPQFIIGRFRR